MKRLTALLAALMLLAAALPASAATLMDKFTGQLLAQGFKGTVTFSAAGAETAAMSGDDWAWLSAALPRLTIEATHSFVADGKAGDGQAALNVLVDGAAAARTALLYDATLMGLSSDFLTGYGDAWYAAARDWNPMQLLQSSEWPPVWHLLQSTQGQSAEWQDQVSQHLVSFQTKLGAWLNGYAAASTGSGEDGAYTQLQWIIPAEDVKKEINALLAEFYGNEALLTLLRQAATPQEAACYLQSGMAPIFAGWVDRLALAGEIRITRRYSAAGSPILDEISLPFTDGQALKRLTVSLIPGEGGDTWRIQGETKEGAAFDVSCLDGGEQIYAGTAEVTLPGQDGKAQHIAFDYNLSWDGGKEIYSLTTDRFEQTIRGTLVIKPHEEGKPTQSLTLKAALSSASAQRSSTHLNAELTWRDLDGDASVTAVLAGRTAAPTPVDKLHEQQNIQRLDQLPPDGLEPLLAEWGAHFSAWLTDAAALLLPTALPGE